MYKNSDGNPKNESNLNGVAIDISDFDFKISDNLFLNCIF